MSRVQGEPIAQRGLSSLRLHSLPFGRIQGRFLPHTVHSLAPTAEHAPCTLPQ